MLHRALWEALPEQDKRRKDYKAFRQAFENAVMRGQWTSSYQLAMPFNEPTDGETNVGLPPAPQMALSDFQMVHWIAQRTSAQGKHLWRCSVSASSSNVCLS